MGILTNLGERDVLFIDEIHRLPRVVEELLYPAMEDFAVNFVMDKGLNARTHAAFRCGRFTLVAATTRPGMLTSPLRERFGIFHHLDFYSGPSSARIVTRSAAILDAPIEPDGAVEIARRSRGTPRIVNRLLRRVRDYAQVKARGIVTAAVARDALDREGVDEAGLDRLDRRFLVAIIDSTAAGPSASRPSPPPSTTRRRRSWRWWSPICSRSASSCARPSGRRATPAAYAHLGVAAPRARHRPGRAASLIDRARPEARR